MSESLKQILSESFGHLIQKWESHGEYFSIESSFTFLYTEIDYVHSINPSILTRIRHDLSFIKRKEIDEFMKDFQCTQWKQMFYYAITVFLYENYDSDLIWTSFCATYLTTTIRIDDSLPETDNKTLSKIASMIKEQDIQELIVITVKYFLKDSTNNRNVNNKNKESVIFSILEYCIKFIYQTSHLVLSTQEYHKISATIVNFDLDNIPHHIYDTLLYHQYRILSEIIVQISWNQNQFNIAYDWMVSNINRILNIVLTAMELSYTIREYLIKKLVLPIVKLIPNKDTIDRLWKSVERLYLSSSSSNDHLNQSTLLALIVSSEDLRAFDVLRWNQMFWDITLQFMLSTELLIRKRGAYLLQQLSSHSFTNPKVVATNLLSSSGQQSSSKKSKKKLKNKSNKKMNNQDDHNKEIQCIDHNSSNCSTTRPWYEIYLTIYHQVEGCRQDHLVSQIWSSIDYLFHLLLTINPTIQSEECSLGDPILSFDWLKVLIRCLLQCQVPSLRKLILYKLLSRHILLNIYDDKVLSWISKELIQYLDDSVYYPVKFSDYTVNVECSINLLDTEKEKNLSIHDLTYPGVLLPSFLYYIISSHLFDHSKERVKWFMSELIDGISNLNSFTASKWILRIFSEDIVLCCYRKNDLINDHFTNHSMTVLWGLLSISDIQKLKSFYHKSIVCSNNTVKKQILQGYLILFIIGYPLIETTIDLKFDMILSFLRFLLIEIGMDELQIGSDNTYLELLIKKVNHMLIFHTIYPLGLSISTFIHNWIALDPIHSVVNMSLIGKMVALCRLYNNNNDNDDDDSSNDHKEIVLPQNIDLPNQLGIDDGVNHGINLLYSIGKEMIQLGNKLYTHTYIPIQEQRLVIAYLSGLASILSYINININNHIVLWNSKHTKLFNHLEYAQNLLKALDMSNIGGYLLSQVNYTIHRIKSFDQDSLHLISNKSYDMIDRLYLWDEIMSAMCCLFYPCNPSKEGDRLRDHLVTEILMIASNNMERNNTEENDVSSLLSYFTLSMLSNILPAVIKTYSSNTRRYDIVVGVDFTDSNKIPTLLNHIISTLVPLQPITNTIYALVLSKLSGDHSINNNNNGSNSIPILLDFIETYSHYSQYTSMLLEIKWKVISYTIQYSLCYLKLSTSSRLSISNRKLHPSYLPILSDAIAVSNDKTLAQIIQCCTQYIQMIWYSLPFRSNDSTLIDSISTNSISDYVINLKSDLIFFLSSVWSAIYSEGTGVDVNLLQPFIDFLFNMSVIDILSDRFLQNKISQTTISQNITESNGSNNQNTILFYFESILSIGLTNNRSHVIQYLTGTLYDLWIQRIDISILFFPVMPSILLYRETVYEDTSISDAMPVVTKKPTFSNINPIDKDYCVESYFSNNLVNGVVVSRILVMSFLEVVGNRILICPSTDNSDFNHPKEFNEMIQNAIDRLAKELIDMNLLSTYSVAAIIGSPLFGEKLRCWQTLCILSKIVSQAVIYESIDSYFKILSDVCAHSIRVHMEIFGSVLAIRHPELFYSKLISILKDFNHQTQTLSSYFIILGHVITYNVTMEDKSLPRNMLSINQAHQLIHTLIPWLSCANGLPRAIAQYLMVYLIPMITAQPSIETRMDMSDITHIISLQSIYTYLTENKESSRIIQRQESFFKEYNLMTLTTVSGIQLLAKKQFYSDLSIGNNMTSVNSKANTGPMTGSTDFLPDHLLTILMDLIKENSILNVSENDKLMPNLGIGNGFAMGKNSAQPNSIDFNIMGYFVMQTKRIPFQDLLLHMTDENDEDENKSHDKTKSLYDIQPIQNFTSKSRNSSQNQNQRSNRHSIQIVASLLEKHTNIAGIARTSEIFAVEGLTISNKAIMKSQEFLSISVTSSQWLPIYEVPPIHIPSYLSTVRQQGYTIIGIEQTDSSIPLHEVMFPEKCLLLLGKEKEGIPVELLQEVDICIEIPQFGVIRSLNVHVCASIILWEYTKQHVLSPSSLSSLNQSRS